MSGIWIIGAGELASGMAWRLQRSGYRVIMSEIEHPLSVRRRTCFSEAVFQGRWTIEGIEAVRVETAEAAFAKERISVIVDPRLSRLKDLQPQAIIDARMTKKDPGARPLDGVPLIGIGPGFVAGGNADLVLETHRLGRPGEVLRSGSALPNTGKPGPVGGETVRRLLRSPADGHLQAHREIGDLVRAGEVVGEIGGLPLVPVIDGLLRGLIHPSVELFQGMKVGDVDPRGESIDPDRMSDKSLNLGGGALEALLSLGITPA
jgi:xanthine dehydrogenase accessory factor